MQAGAWLRPGVHACRAGPHSAAHHSARPSDTASRCCHARMTQDLRGCREAWEPGARERSAHAAWAARCRPAKQRRAALHGTKQRPTMGSG